MIASRAPVREYGNRSTTAPPLACRLAAPRKKRQPPNPRPATVSSWAGGRSRLPGRAAIEPWRSIRS